jgi:hypothetical protein
MASMSERKDTGAGIQTPLAGGLVEWADLMKGAPEVDWLVSDIMPSRRRAMLYAESGVGKSLVAFDLAAHIATGRAWRGRAVNEGPVYYIASENQDTYFAALQAWDKLHRGAAHWAKAHGEGEPPLHFIPAPA